MSVTVECDRTDCAVSFEAGIEGDWSGVPQTVRDFSLQDTDYGDLIYVYLPEGWRVDRVGLNTVIHCPDHADAR